MDERQPTSEECPPVPDLTIANLTSRSITVAILISAMPERYRGGSPTPTPEETPFNGTPVQTFADTVELDAYSTDDQRRDYSKEYASVPRKTGLHRLEVDVTDGPERVFPFRPPYGGDRGFKVYLHEDDGLEGGESGSHCDP